MSETSLHRDEIIGEGHQREGPREQHGSRDALFERQCQPKKASQADEEIICLASCLDEEAFFGGFRHADPEEIKALQGVFDEAKFMRVDLLFGKLAFVTDVGVFAHLSI